MKDKVICSEKIYKKEANRLPKILALHDLSSLGKCALNLIIPTLSVAGVECISLPTALLSSHTAYPDPKFLHLDEMVWTFYKDIKSKIDNFDAIYSGYVSNVTTLESLIRIFDDSCAFKWVDPVLGDHGKAYKTCSKDHIKLMRCLCSKAKVISPNLTEASLLLDQEYKGQCLDKKECIKLLDSLLDLGADYVLLKGVQKDDKIYNFLASRKKGFAQNLVQSEKITRFSHEVELGVWDSPFQCLYSKTKRLGQNLHGTGDLFASLFLASLYTEHHFGTALAFASSEVMAAMERSFSLDFSAERGVNIEPNLSRISTLLALSDVL